MIKHVPMIKKHGCRRLSGHCWLVLYGQIMFFFVTWVTWAASQLQRRICLVSMGIVWIHPPTPQWSKCWRGDRVSNGLRDTTSRSICMDQKSTQVGFLPFRQTWQGKSFHWVRWFPAKKLQTTCDDAQRITPWISVESLYPVQTNMPTAFLVFVWFKEYIYI